MRDNDHKHSIFYAQIDPLKDFFLNTEIHAFQRFIEQIYQRKTDPYVVADGIIERLRGTE